MRDAEYVFYADAAEKKRIARSAKSKNRTGHGAIKFPSDYMSKKERERMNGEVKTYNLSKPMKYDEFKALSQYLRVEYMEGLDKRFKPSNKMVAEMFGITPRTVSLIRKDLKISALRGRGGCAKDENAPNVEAWNEWLKAEMPNDVVQKKNDDIHIAESPKESNNKSDAVFNVSEAEFTVFGKPSDIALLLKVMFGNEERAFKISVGKEV